MHQPTTLILGAGSSFDYGYPVGRELRKRILALDGNELKRLQPPGPVWNPFAFLEEFRGSQMRSIDAFLARRTKYTEIGKLAIARVLLECEATGGPDLESLKDDWRGYLINRLMVEDWDNFDPSWLTIITFNYDRSLEQALCTSVQAVYGATEEAARERLAKLKILHVYGCIGDATRWGAQLPYGHASKNPEIMRQMCINACQNIRVIPEGRDDDASLTPIREALSKAQRLCFLGFSFDAANVRRLGAPMSFVNEKFGQMKHMAATTIGMTQAEQEAAYALLGAGANLVSSQFPSTFRSVGCEALLRETLWLG